MKTSMKPLILTLLLISSCTISDPNSDCALETQENTKLYPAYQLGSEVIIQPGINAKIINCWDGMDFLYTPSYLVCLTDENKEVKISEFSIIRYR